MERSFEDASSEVLTKLYLKPLDAEQVRFLRALFSWADIATPQELELPADRKQDRARQKCRRNGLVIFDGGYWRMTPKGLIALQRAPPRSQEGRP
jgi:hypothetical protein